MNDVKRVVKNTLFLYAKMIITVFISLYTVRIVISSIGVRDFGIFNLVAGIVAMLSFLSASMTVSTQRFFSNYLGEKNFLKLKSSFQTSIVLNLIIGFILVFLLEIIGYFFIFDFINVESDRIESVFIVYQLVVLNTFINLMGLSFDAAIIAREDLHIDAIIGVIEVILRLIFALTILSYSGDKLIYYTFTIVLVALFSRLAKINYASSKYKEVNFKNFKIDKLQFRIMLSFFGWNTFGAASGIIRNQGIAIVINLIFGAILNASYGIALQVSSQIKNFSENLLKSVRPQIFKLEGSNKREYMLKASLLVCKLGYFMVLLIGLPIILEIDYILKIWLNEVPKDTNILCQLSIILILINILSNGIQTALQSIGEIKLYQAIVGSLIITTPFISYFLLIDSYPVYWVLLVSIMIEILATLIRVILLSKYSSFKIKSFLSGVVLPVLKVSLFSVPMAYLISNINYVNSIIGIFISFALIFIAIIIFIYIFGLDINEKSYLNNKFKFYSNKI